MPTGPNISRGRLPSEGASSKGCSSSIKAASVSYAGTKAFTVPSISTTQAILQKRSASRQVGFRDHGRRCVPRRTSASCYVPTVIVRFMVACDISTPGILEKAAVCSRMPDSRYIPRWRSGSVARCQLAAFCRNAEVKMRRIAGTPPLLRGGKSAAEPFERSKGRFRDYPKGVGRKVEAPHVEIRR